MIEFNLDDFRSMLDDPAMIECFASRYPAAEKLFKEFLEARKPDPLRGCPGGLTALQFTIFDNGETKPATRKRQLSNRTLTRHAITIAAWTNTDVNFRERAEEAFNANAYLWTAENAPKVTAELRKQRLIDEATVSLMEQMIAGGGGDRYYSIPMKKAHRGSKWMSGHIMVVDLSSPSLIFVTPNGNYISNEFSTVHANGDPLPFGKGVTHMARIAFDQSNCGWANDIQIDD